MKGLVNTYLNLRIGKPSVNASNPSYFNPGDAIEIVDTVVGDSYKENNLWYQLDNGGFVWSGGVKKISTPVSTPVNIETNDWIKFFGIDKLWSKTDLTKINIAILDSGVDYEHPDLKGCIREKENFFWPGKDCMDFDGHGTHCAGILAGTGQERIFGVAYGSNLYVAKIVGVRGFGINEKVLCNALKWAMEKADIISISLGIKKNNPEVYRLIKEATNNGKIIISAIGNVPKSSGDFPALYPEVISVGSINNDFELSSFTVKSDKIDISVPGENIISTYPSSKGNYGSESGTSMSAPFVAGLAAIFKSADEGLNHQDLRAKLRLLSEPKKQDTFKYSSIKPQPILLL